MKTNRSILRLLAATALAAGFGTLPGPAGAVDRLATPEGENVVAGGARFDRPAPGLLDVTQTTDRAVIDWRSFDIGEDAAARFAQPSTASLAVNRITGGDPAQILGRLSANGRLMVLDRNGVLFGPNAVIDVGGIVASTGDIDAAAVMRGDTTLELRDFGAGEIRNMGAITVRDAGLAAFVAPSVRNDGTIAARMGKVALASGGSRATVDLYGDGLVEIALDPARSNAFVGNAGRIDAEGGTVALSAAAARGIVDDVINMSGIVSVASAEAEGGRIVLRGGEAGRVAVTGALDASGVGGGGTVGIGGADTRFTGTIAATGNGASVDVSGDALSLGGDIRTSPGASVTFDPASFTIGAPEAATILSSLAGGGTVNVMARESITLNAAIDSTAQGNAAILRFGDEGGAPGLTVALNNTVRLGTNQVLTGDATKVAVAANGLIRNGVDVAAAGATIQVAPGTFAEDVRIAKDGLTLRGANAGKAGNDAARGAETLILASASGLVVTGGNVTIDGFAVKGGVDGIVADGATQAAIRNSVVTDAASNGVRAVNGAGLTVSGNRIASVGADAVHVERNGGAVTVKNNSIAGTGDEGIEIRGRSTTGSPGAVAVSGNVVDGTIGTGVRGDGIQIAYATSGLSVTGNTVTATRGDGIEIHGSDNGTVARNVLTGNRDQGIEIDGAAGSAGPHGNFTVRANTIEGSGREGVYMANLTGASAVKSNAVLASGRDGILLRGVEDAAIDDNVVATAGGDGIALERARTAHIGGNLAAFTRDAGISAADIAGASVIDGNKLAMTGGDGIAAADTGGILVKGNEIALAGIAPGAGAPSIAWNDADGVRIARASGPVTIDGNAIRWTGGDGLSVESAGPVAITVNHVGETGIASTAISDPSGTVLGGSRTALLDGANRPLFGQGELIGFLEAALPLPFASAYRGGDGIRVAAAPSAVPFAGFETLPDGGYAVRVRGNAIRDAGGDGIEIEGGTALVDSNRVVASGGDGIHIRGQGADDAAKAVNNRIKGAGQDGVAFEALAHGLLSSGRVADSGRNGFMAQGGDNGSIALAGNVFTGNPTGALMESGEIDLTGASNVFSGGSTGIVLAPVLPGGASALSLRNDTLGTTVFEGQADRYVSLRNGALFAPGAPTLIDGTLASFDGIVPAALGGPLPGPVYDRLEAFIDHYADDSSLGLILFGTREADAGDAVDIAEEDVFNSFAGFRTPVPGLRVTITGLPRLPGQTEGGGTALNVAQLEPAAGGPDDGKPRAHAREQGERPESIEPASGPSPRQAEGPAKPSGEEPSRGISSCWGDAVRGLNGGQSASYGYSTDPNASLDSLSDCRSGEF